MKFRPLVRSLLLVLTGALTCCSDSAKPRAGAEAGAAPAAATFTGDPAPVIGAREFRLVWLEQEDPEKLLRRVMAYDPADGLGIRILTPEAADFARPLFSPDGSSVVYTQLHARQDGEKTAYVPEMIFHPWGGTAKSLGQGMAVDFWRDPADEKSYIYAVEQLLPGPPNRLTGEKLLRFTPDQPNEREIMWTATPLGTDQFQLSRDGRRAAGLFPFPKAALADLTMQELTPLAAGGWPAGAADDSYAAAVLDGTRRRLRFFAPNMDPGWELSFMGAPGWEDGGLLHPRWSNDPALMVFTGPHREDEPAGDLSVVRFREDLRSITSTVRLTTGRRALSPDLWVAGGTTSVTTFPQQPVVVPPPEPKPWPLHTDDLSFAWDHARREVPIPAGAAPAALNPNGFATWSRYFGMDCSRGWFETDPATAARVASASAASQAWSMEMILTERPAGLPLSVRLAALMLDDGREAFALYRVDRRLVLRILLGGTPERPAMVYPVVLTNLAIESDRPVHLVISLRNNRLACWVDGQMQKDFLLPSSGLAAWGPGSLTFGDPDPYGSQWSGSMERIAMWSRALGDDEIREASAVALSWVEKRTRPVRHKIKATLAEPAHSSENPPDQLLNVDIWEVQQVFMGQLDAKRIAVAGWERLNGRDFPAASPASGESVTFWIEPMEEHPELEAVPKIGPPGIAQLPLYFQDPTNPATSF